MAQAPELLAENLLETDFLPLLPLRKVRDFSPRLLFPRPFLSSRTTCTFRLTTSPDSLQAIIEKTNEGPTEHHPSFSL